MYFFGTGFCWSYHIAYSVVFIGRVPTGTGSHPSLSYVDGFYYAGRNHPLTRVSSNNLSHTIFAAMTVDAIQSKLATNPGRRFLFFLRLRRSCVSARQNRQATQAIKLSKKLDAVTFAELTNLKE